MSNDMQGDMQVIRTALKYFIVALLLGVLLALCLLIACPTHAQAATISWDAPRTYEDNTRINAGDIKAYKVYYALATSPSQTIGNFTSEAYTLVSSSTTSITLTFTLDSEPSYTTGGPLYLPRGKWFFVVTTLDQSDVESEFSNQVHKSIAPAAETPQKQGKPRRKR